MRLFSLILVLILASCAASQERLDTIAEEEASRLLPTSEPLSKFATFELKHMTLSPEVKAKSEKVEQAAILEKKLEAELEPLFSKWSSSDKTGRSGTLIVQPDLVRLRIVSGGARFFAGAFSGDSFIDLDLILVDEGTGKEIAKTRITKHASAMGGAWSVGKTDENLHDYIAHITQRYLARNY